MTEPSYPYQQWVEEALTGILKRALRQAEEQGLAGEHHYYINFKTRADGVDMPPFLRAQYPEEITIVLQHQFEDLHVEEDGFRVALYFSGRRQALFVPFSAVVSFADPAVDFGIQVAQLAPDIAGADAEEAAPGDGPAEREDAADGDYVQPNAETAILPDADEGGGEDEAEEADEADAAEEEAAEAAEGAEVIALDKFRNKS
ncbi:MAG: ClpXP protease specificity-enhancing factor SspB [Rhodospirillales bacterium]|nr:ClpXP protease specificity-enhancing factor SspB [Rhodospirillales bacterium]